MRTNEVDPAVTAMLADFDQRQPQWQLGFSALHAWLRDVASQGLGSWQTQPESAWEAIATQLADAKLPELAKRIRRLFYLRLKPNWPEHAAGELGELYLLLQAFQKMPQLPPALQAEVLIQGGRLITEKNLLASAKGHLDHWHLLALRQGVEDQLRYQRAWLWGAQQHRPAQVLDFAWQDNPFKRQWTLPSCYYGTLCFYPGSFPLRATPLQLDEIEEHPPIVPPFTNWEQVAHAHSLALTQQPWLSVFPVLIAGVAPFLHESIIYLRDERGQAVPLPSQATSSWQILAHRPETLLTVFGEWQNGQLLPLTLLDGPRILPLQT